MLEKTLKEKVDLAKKCLDEQLDSLEQHKYGVVVVRKALTALEDKVAELEKERRKLWSTINELMDGKEAPDGK